MKPAVPCPWPLAVRLKAQTAVATAKRHKLLFPQPCVRCGDEAIAHHDDYDKPLDVTWLCLSHHKTRHRELGWGYRGKSERTEPMITLGVRMPVSLYRKVCRDAKRQNRAVVNYARWVIRCAVERRSIEIDQ